MEHRLTKPATPKTNGMVERVKWYGQEYQPPSKAKYANKNEMEAE